MDRTKQAIQFAKQTLINTNPRFRDKDFRIRWWRTLSPLQKQMFIMEMCSVALIDFDRIEPLEVVE